MPRENDKLKFNSSQDYLKNRQKNCKHNPSNDPSNYSQNNICCIPSMYRNKHAYMKDKSSIDNHIDQVANYHSRLKLNSKACCFKDIKHTYNSSYVKKDKYELYNKQLYNIHNQNLNTSNTRIKQMVMSKMSKNDYIHSLKYPRK